MASGIEKMKLVNGVRGSGDGDDAVASRGVGVDSGSGSKWTRNSWGETYGKGAGVASIDGNIVTGTGECGIGECNIGDYERSIAGIANSKVGGVLGKEGTTAKIECGVGCNARRINGYGARRCGIGEEGAIGGIEGSIA